MSFNNVVFSRLLHEMAADFDASQIQIQNFLNVSNYVRSQTLLFVSEMLNDGMPNSNTATIDVEAVDIEPEDEEGAVDADTSPRAALPKLKSAITSGPPGSLAPKNTKGRGFREGRDSDRQRCISNYEFDSLGSDSGLGTQQSIEGWIIMIGGLHEETQEEHLRNAFVVFGEIKNLHLYLDRRTGFAKGYALIVYANFEEAEKAISTMNEAELLTQTITVDWAFNNEPRKSTRSGLSHRSRSPGRRF